MEEIIQTVMPSMGTKLVCTRCFREDWHKLMLRRKRGLIEALCLQVDGSGCYPNSTRGNCDYVDPQRVQCPQLAEWDIWDRANGYSRWQRCTDHVGIALEHEGANITPLSD